MQEAYINVCAACRKKAHMTQEQWAEALRVSVESVKAWEGDRRIPGNYLRKNQGASFISQRGAAGGLGIAGWILPNCTKAGRFSLTFLL